MSKRILTIVYSLGKGGVERTAQIFSQSYTELGMNVKVLATREGGVRKEPLEKSGIACWIGTSNTNIKEIEEWDPDIIHIHSHYFSQKDVEAFSSLFPGRAVVEQNIFSKPNPWTEKMDVSFQLTDWCDWRFRKNSNSLVVKTAVVPNATHTQNFSRRSPQEITQFRQTYNIDNEAIVIGRIGQSHEGKWSPVLVESFNRLCKRHKHLHLILVNPPKSIVEQAERSNHKDSITVIDRIIGDSKLSVAYSAMDIFALAAERGESFGNVLAESMLCETPAVVLSTPWRDNSQCEVVGHRQAGLVALTPKSFEKGIEILVEDKNLRSQLGKAGRARVIENYDYLKVGAAALKAIAGDFNSPTQKELRARIISTYKDALDRPSILTMLFLKSGPVWLTRYTTGYVPLYRLPFDTVFEAARFSKRRVFKFFRKTG